MNIAESPLLLLLLCGFVAMSATAMWYFVARHWLPAAVALVALAVGIAGAAFSILVVNDNERIRHTIRELAAAVQRNDRDGVLRWISTSDPATREDARREMELCTFSQCWVTQIDEVQYGADRQTGSVAVMIFCSAAHQVHGEGSAMVRLFLQLRRDPDQIWRLSGFQYAIQSGL